MRGIAPREAPKQQDRKAAIHRYRLRMRKQHKTIKDALTGKSLNAPKSMRSDHDPRWTATLRRVKHSAAEFMT